MKRCGSEPRIQDLRLPDRALRRGAVVAQVAVALTLLLGFAALAVDVGMMYTARAELQRSADAAALAAAAELADFSSGDPKVGARAVAAELAAINTVAAAGVKLATSDVIFGYASVSSATGKYTFEPNETFPNAVRVKVRRTGDSPSGALALYFARILGHASADVGAEATAVLTPRDICFVLDLSASHNDDSSLRSYKNIEIANKDVWRGLRSASTPIKDSLGFTSSVAVTRNGNGTSTVTVTLSTTAGSAASGLSSVVFGIDANAQAAAMASASASGGTFAAPTVGTDSATGISGLKFTSTGTALGANGAAGSRSFTFTMGDQYVNTLTVGTKAGTGVDKSVQHNLGDGPLLGNMDNWGTEVTGPGWNFTADSGLQRLAKGSSWSMTTAAVSRTLSKKGFGTYNTAEMSAINSSTYDGTTANYQRRVLVALGIYRWKSGKSGGQAGGNGDNVIDAGEVVAMVPYPKSVDNPESGSRQVGGSWEGFVDYVRSSSTSMTKYDPNNEYFGDPGLQYRFGLKTWVDYIQEQQVGISNSPGMGGVKTQPMGAVADGVLTSLDIIESLQSNDRVGTASYGTYGYGPDTKPSHMSWLTTDLDSIRARVADLQAGMWTSNTNIAQGIDKGVTVLFKSPNARPNAAKIMFLLTDGIANATRANGSSNESQAKLDTLAAARDARAMGVRIYTVSVGANADKQLMEQVAEIGEGESFHAEGTVDAYYSKLQAIFRELGGKRPVVLIQ